VQTSLSNEYFTITWPGQSVSSFTYTVKKSRKPVVVSLPVFEIEGKRTAGTAKKPYAERRGYSIEERCTGKHV
jgi:hypothetical protein